MNSLKFKKKEEISIFDSIQSPNKVRYEKFKLIRQNDNKRTLQKMKLQRSYRQPRIQTKRDRYESIDNVSEVNQRIKSLSLKRGSRQLRKSQQKSISLFKRPTKPKYSSIESSSLQKSNKETIPYTQRSNKPSVHKKLTIIEREANTQKLQQSMQSKSGSRSKFRVKSTFTKVESSELTNSASNQPSQNSLICRQKIKSNHKKSQSLSSIDLIKSLIKSQQYRQALLIIKKTFSKQNDLQNPQLLELFATCMYNLQQYQEVTKITEKIFSLKTFCNSQIYVMSCLSYAKLKNYYKSLDVISKGAQSFPSNAQIFYYKGKILYHMKKYEQAQQAYSTSNCICSLPETLLCLADCYRKTCQREKQLQTLNKILNQQKSYHLIINFDQITIRRLKVMFQIGQYDEIIHQLQTQKFRKNLTLPEIKADVQFIEGLCYYKKSLTSRAFEKFQDCIVSQYFYLQSLKMLIVLEILEKNFYEASHLCNQISKSSVKVQSDDIFDLLVGFVDGSISLVRRNFKDGIQMLSKIQLSLDNKEYKKYNSCKEWISYQDIENFEVLKTVKNLLHLFIAFGLFCIGQYNFCKTAILKQRQLHNEPKFHNGLEYNYKLCEAILSFQQKSYANTLLYLQESEKILPNHMEVFFYRAVTLIHILYKSHQNPQPEQKFTQQEESQMIESIKSNLENTLKYVSQTANNTRATILYYKSLFYAYLEEWKDALTSIQQCISKSDDNYWRYYYTKAMILSCVHNFQQAVTQLTVAINLSQGQRGQCFLLRSKCLQIEGKGNDAFYDLQQYIALKPQDQDVHKYAGQILFENGAFQDALVAFQHKQVPKTTQNFDIFLTMAKTFFLLGKFNQAQQKMYTAYQLKPEDSQIQFDAKIISFTGRLISQINNNKINQSEVNFIKQLEEHFYLKNSQKKYGKIFREIDFYLFQALISVYYRDYAKAIENFKKHLSEKRKIIIFEDNTEGNAGKFLQNQKQQDLEKISHELRIYTNQMKYNITVCYLLKGQIQNAKMVLKDVKIDENENFYSNFSKFKTSILNEIFAIEREQILPNKNKLSQFLPAVTINLKQKKTEFKLKLCIPFPKVQPPQIFPTFDKKLIKTISIFGVQGKPQAPWIVKEDNVIKFTQRIDYVSRLDFNDSEPNSSTTAIIDLDQSRTNSKKKLMINGSQSQRSSLFSKRTLKKKNSININF